MYKNFFETVYEIVKQIPAGKATSYGQVALLSGKPNTARAVGYALKAIPLNRHYEIPWHRVINTKGYISIRNIPNAHSIQRNLLEKEGIIFCEDGKIDLSKYGWFPYST